MKNINGSKKVCTEVLTSRKSVSFPEDSGVSGKNNFTDEQKDKRIEELTTIINKMSARPKEKEQEENVGNKEKRSNRSNLPSEQENDIMVVSKEDRILEKDRSGIVKKPFSSNETKAIKDLERKLIIEKEKRQEKEKEFKKKEKELQKMKDDYHEMSLKMEELLNENYSLKRSNTHLCDSLDTVKRINMELEIKNCDRQKLNHQEPSSKLGKTSEQNIDETNKVNQLIPKKSINTKSDEKESRLTGKSKQKEEEVKFLNNDRNEVDKNECVAKNDNMNAVNKGKGTKCNDAKNGVPKPEKLVKGEAKQLVKEIEPLPGDKSRRGQTHWCRALLFPKAE